MFGFKHNEGVNIRKNPYGHSKKQFLQVTCTKFKICMTDFVSTNSDLPRNTPSSFVKIIQDQS